MSADVRENRLRQVADRRGLLLVKCRRRDPGACGYGLYALVENTAGNRGGLGAQRGAEAAQSIFDRNEGLTLDEVEDALADLDERQG